MTGIALGIVWWAAAVLAPVSVVWADESPECHQRFAVTGLVTDQETGLPLQRALASIAVKQIPPDEVAGVVNGQLSDSWAWGSATLYTDASGRFEGVLEGDMARSMVLTDATGCTGTPARIDFAITRAGYHGVYGRSIGPNEYTVERRPDVTVIDIGRTEMLKKPPEPR